MSEAYTLVTTVAVKPLTQVLTDRLSTLEKVVLLVSWLYFVTIEPKPKM